MHTYEIRVQGQLDHHWSAWFSGLAISHDADGTTILRGPLADEAALHGILNKVRDLTLPLLAVSRELGLVDCFRARGAWACFEGRRTACLSTKGSVAAGFCAEFTGTAGTADNPGATGVASVGRWPLQSRNCPDSGRLTQYRENAHPESLSQAPGEESHAGLRAGTRPALALIFLRIYLYFEAHLNQRVCQTHSWA